MNELINSLAFWDTSGSNSIFTLFYSKNLGPEIKNLEKTPYYGRERIFFLLFLAEARLQPFCSSLSDHTVSIGGRSLVLDKNLNFLSVRIVSFSQRSCFLTAKLP